MLVPALPEPVEPVQEWLAVRRGSNVSLRIPQRGDKKALMETVQRNAQQTLALHKTKRASDLTTRSRALEEIAEALDLDSAPLRIECYDISHLQGDDVVASMVVFEDGLQRKSEYRRFQIKGFAGQDDVRSMHEVITRRFRRYLAEKERTGEWTDGTATDGTPTAADAAASATPTSAHATVTPAPVDGTPDGSGAAGAPGAGAGLPAPLSGGDALLAGVEPVTDSLKDDDGRPRKFAYPPQLVVVDGGQPQVAAARRALDELGIDDIAVCGLAKRLEEVWVPGEDDPVVLPRTSEGLYLLQRVRDEAHRFAITYQRTKRAKRFRAGPLDDIPGLGDTRKQALIKHFGSVKKLRSATIEQIQEVPGIGRKTAETIAVALAQAAPAAPAVNTATGEIIEDEEPDTTAGSSGEPVTAGAPDDRRGQET